MQDQMGSKRTKAKKSTRKPDSTDLVDQLSKLGEDGRTGTFHVDRPSGSSIDVHLMTGEIIAAGTSGGFGYIVDSMRFGRSRGVITVEVNPEETECSQYCEFHLRGPASIWLGLLADVLEGSHA